MKPILKILFCLLIFSVPRPIHALHINTHAAINEYIAKNTLTLDGFSLESYLKGQLGFQKGIKENLQLNETKEIWEWIKLGGRTEDDSILRSRHHFHDPFMNKGFVLGESSIKWAQKAIGEQWPGGYYSWLDVREYFHRALIADKRMDREKFFAETFRGLGQLMHLVQDGSVPSHSRIEMHTGNDYERFVLNYQNKIAEEYLGKFENLLHNPIWFDQSLLFSVSPLALIPFANIFDAEKYTGLNPEVTLGNDIGLSEYVNANFFGEDSIFMKYPHPQKERTNAIIIEQIAEDGEVDRGFYIMGYQSEKLARYSYFANRSSGDMPEGWKYILDDAVYEDYAQKLIPRAVGYSAGLLNYFFRGDIEITVSEDGFYAMTEGGNQEFTKIALMARNITPNGEEMPDGKIHLVVHYKEALEDPFQAKEVPTTDFKYIVVPEANGVKAIPFNEYAKLEFDLSAVKLLPVIATDVYLQVVYRGKLGLETDAVVVGLKDVREPTPFDIFNDMHKICIDKQWWDAGSKEVIDLMDSDGDGLPDLGDVFPHNLEDYIILFSPFENPRYVSHEQYHIKFDIIRAGEHVRAAYVISDENIYVSYVSRIERADTRDTYGHGGYYTCFPNRICLYYVEGIKNQADYLPPDKCEEPNSGQGCFERVPPPFIKYWGKDIWFGIVELFPACLFPELCKGYPGD